MRKGGDELRAGAATFDERGKIYGDNYLRIGPVMDALFPDGLFIKGPEMWNRMHLYMMTMVKATRLAVTHLDHQDSAHDAMVYNAMLSCMLHEDRHTFVRSGNTDTCKCGEAESNPVHIPITLVKACGNEACDNLHCPRVPEDVK